MTYKVFVDGQEGTTGLQIHERLAKRNDIEILVIDPEKRKEPSERAKLINASDITFLCLPDVAAKESVSLCSNTSTKIIDASTAHRTNPEFAYGLPELSDVIREKLKTSTRHIIFLNKPKTPPFIVNILYINIESAFLQ